MGPASFARPICFLVLAGLLFWSQRLPSQVAGARAEQFRQRSLQAEQQGLAQPFKGITANGAVMPGLFPVRATGVSTEPVRIAAEGFLRSLTPALRARTLFALDDPEWRKWMNQDFYVRQGVSFKEMTDAQRDAATGLLRASLSAKGLKLTQDIMKLNYTLGELSNNDFERFGDQYYWITVMGEPSSTEPWGWQLDGHHGIINYFVQRDQVVMTPTFMGSEPVIARDGKYKGTIVLQAEQNKGLAVIQSLTESQRPRAVIKLSKTGNENIGEAFKDNVVLDYAGIRASEFSADQRQKLLDVIQEYVSNMDDGHAKVKMDEVRSHLDNTYFAWIGGTEAASVFYYRIHSPVILIEFDHQTPANLRQPGGSNGPNREHIHTVVRTPNGNDYGKDLLRQHYVQHPHGQN
jgi:hypothetical protein